MLRNFKLLSENWHQPLPGAVSWKGSDQFQKFFLQLEARVFSFILTLKSCLYVSSCMTYYTMIKMIKNDQNDQNDQKWSKWSKWTQDQRVPWPWLKASQSKLAKIQLISFWILEKYHNILADDITSFWGLRRISYGINFVRE